MGSEKALPEGRGHVLLESEGKGELLHLTLELSLSTEIANLFLKEKNKNYRRE